MGMVLTHMVRMREDVDADAFNAIILHWLSADERAAIMGSEQELPPGSNADRMDATSLTHDSQIARMPVTAETYMAWQLSAAPASNANWVAGEVWWKRESAKEEMQRSHLAEVGEVGEKPLAYIIMATPLAAVQGSRARMAVVTATAESTRAATRRTPVVFVMVTEPSVETGGNARHSLCARGCSL
jgi:hypothetical protein